MEARGIVREKAAGLFRVLRPPRAASAEAPERAARPPRSEATDIGKSSA